MDSIESLSVHTLTEFFLHFSDVRKLRLRNRMLLIVRISDLFTYDTICLLLEMREHLESVEVFKWKKLGIILSLEKLEISHDWEIVVVYFI